MYYHELTADSFLEAMEKVGRGDSWTSEGAQAMAEILNELEGSTEFDAVGIDCEFCEYTSIGELFTGMGYKIADLSYSLPLDDDAFCNLPHNVGDFLDIGEEYREAQNAEMKSILEGEGCVYEANGVIIYQQ